MIYWFTGQPGAGKTVLGTKLKDFLQTEKRNWRKDVFHIDGDDLRELTLNKDYSEAGRIQNIKNAQLLAYFLQNKNCDIVVSLVAPYKELREEFKVKEYQSPEENFFDMDTTSDNPTQSFTKLIHYLKEVDKI